MFVPNLRFLHNFIRLWIESFKHLKDSIHKTNPTGLAVTHVCINAFWTFSCRASFKKSNDGKIDKIELAMCLCAKSTYTAEREISLVQLCEGDAGLSTIKTLTANASGPLAQGVLAGRTSLGGTRQTGDSLVHRPESDLHLNLPSTGVTQAIARFFWSVSF